MGHIGTYGDPVYISELENDIGLTPDSGTVTGVEIEAGKFEGVQNPSTVPLFKIPTHTSHLSNSEGWKNGTIRTVKTNNRDGITSETTFTPPNSGSVNIVVKTLLRQFTNDAGYTNNAGTITGISFNSAGSVIPAEVYSGTANIKVYGNISDYNNDGNGDPNSKYATKKYGSQFTHIEYDTVINGFTHRTNPTRTIYLLRYGKLRLLYYTLAYSVDQADIKTNTEFILGTFGTTGKDKPSSIYNGKFFNIGDGETVYNSNVNHYYPVSVILDSSSSLRLSIGGEGTTDALHPHDACTTTNFRAVWLSDYEYN